jgi:hypothetical protein
MLKRWAKDKTIKLMKDKIDDMSIEDLDSTRLRLLKRLKNDMDELKKMTDDELKVYLKKNIAVL